MTLRWLHISDIHECDRDGHLRRRMYAQIIDKAVKTEPKPDLVFLTGDMAFAGTEAEYAPLEEHFIAPLRAALPACPLFTVPGNHDVDRTHTIQPRIWSGDAGSAKAFQATDASGARFRRQMLLPRFASYAAFDRRVSAWGSNWLESEAGAVWWSSEINGVKVSVVGVNTAWLCQDDDDWGKLTPGREMLAAALREAAKTQPDLLIVLGHHPLGALAGEGDVSDAERVTRRLEQANAVYLHGHRHRTQTGHVGYEARGVLSVQAPSAYQAHDNPRWRNGLMWGEADLSSGWLLLQPRQWNEDNEEYNWDTSAGYEADKVPERQGFRLRLPRRAPAAEDAHPPEAAKPRLPPVPPGWEIVDRDAVAAIRANAPSTEIMVQFFDGILPTWRLALAHGVQPRAVAERLANRFRAVHTGAAKPQVVLLAAAGGEGKSTALLHTAAALIEDGQQAWTCLHRQAANAGLPEELFSSLPIIRQHAWAVVIDDADNIATSTLAAVKKIAARTDVHLLLAARDAEWHVKRLVPGLWQPAADFHTEPLSGLDREDAQRIVAGWTAWGDKAIGLLKGRSEADAVTALLGHARELAARQEQGELLGALLVTRQGEDMRDHVRTLVNGLGRTPVIKTHTLRDIYTMVAAMHAENQLYLSRSVLAFALGCEVDELERQALLPLRREAMLDAGDTHVFTRHRRIAEAACVVMREDGEDVDRYYPLLARAARRAFKRNAFVVTNVGDWTHGLARHFVEKDERWWSTAKRVAEAVWEADDNAQTLTAFTSVLRRTGQAVEAMAVLKAAGERFRNRREVLYEWSTVAGALGDYGLDAWLAGRTLADGGEMIDPVRCKLSLAGLGVAFRELFAASRNRAFAGGQAACGQLGLRLPELDATARGYFQKYAAEGRRNGIADLLPEQGIEGIRKAVILGAEEVKPENDPVFFERLLGDPEGYRYTALLRMAGDAKQKGRSGKA